MQRGIVSLVCMLFNDTPTQMFSCISLAAIPWYFCLFVIYTYNYCSDGKCYRMSESCGRTRLHSVDHSHPLKPTAIHRCMGTTYKIVYCDCTENRCNRCQKCRNKLHDRRPSIRWQAHDDQRTPELNRYRSTADIFQHPQGLQMYLLHTKSKRRWFKLLATKMVEIV